MRKSFYVNIESKRKFENSFQSGMIPKKIMDVNWQHVRKHLHFCMIILAGFLLMNQGYCQAVPLKIGISKASPNYLHWLKRADSSIQTVDLYQMSVAEAVQQLGLCDGLLLTGGEDVYPGRYGKEYDTVRCTEMNPHRDTLDMALIDKALALTMPVVGVCRGHQILNVYLGGTLIIDIPKDVANPFIHQCDDYLHCFHSVSINQSTMLAKISLCDSAQVTTNHHQAVDRLSPLLVSNASSDDKLTEGIEWKNPEGKSFLIGVQWHPERMEVSNPFSGPIADEFIRQVTTYSHKHKKTQLK
jgi:putative glutamine amidotransferase